jgi:hypothetical protein
MEVSPAESILTEAYTCRLLSTFLQLYLIPTQADAVPSLCLEHLDYPRATH